MPRYAPLQDIEDFLGEIGDVVPHEYRPASLLEKGLDIIGMEPHAEPEGDLFPFYLKVSIALQITAFGFSLARNQDIKWALVHGLMGPIYLGYVGAKALTLEEARVLEHLFK